MSCSGNHRGMQEKSWLRGEEVLFYGRGFGLSTSYEACTFA